MEAKDTKEIIECAVLVGISFGGKDNINFSIAELVRLAETAGVEVRGILLQNAKEVTPATYIGSGKLEELKDLIALKQANLVIFNNELSGSQQKNLCEFLDTKVIDRTTLILDIFAKRALSVEGKLQVELAQAKYFLPRISGMSGTSGRFGSGGVGMRGPGETKLELDKRVVQKNIQKLQKEILGLKEKRTLRRKQRALSNVKNVSIVGYTNAGKSTLINLITKADIYADDRLFATLDTTSRKLWIDVNKEIVLTDTVGFIDKLPHTFVDAFASTLEEAVDSDLILHVIDVADKDIEIHRTTVLNVLNSVGAKDIPILTVYNKIDKLNKPFAIGFNEVVISTKDNKGIENLKSKMVEMLWNE
ncbi:MAG: GTPase HflX [Clostridia bacterium]